MIKGNIEIFQSYGDTHKSLYKGSNMVVDGFRKTVADVMTHMPNPSGNAPSYAMPAGASSVSSFQIQAMSLGSAKEGYSQRHSRFTYSAIQTSAEAYQLLTPTDNALFEMRDCYSGIGFNQWRYTNAQDANLLKSPTLDNLNDWTVMYAEDNNEGVITRFTDSMAEGTVDVTKFELTAGQQQVTLRQRVPEIALGQVYTMYAEGKAHNATMDFRLARGRNGIVFEYYDFSSGEFGSWDRKNSNMVHTINLPDFYKTDVFRFKLHGHKKDQVFEKNNEYYVEYTFPSIGFVDESFAPWDFNYKNPSIDILRLELCDESRQILKNPNFLVKQSVCVNNDFKYVASFASENAENPTACEQEGLFELVGWSQVNPLAAFSETPGDPNDSSGYGTVRALSKAKNNTIPDQDTGVTLYASSIELGSSGAASITQKFNLGTEFTNRFAYVNNQSTTPELLGLANGQMDNNATLMLSFDTMAVAHGTSPATAANSGYLEISLTRDSDGFTYEFQDGGFGYRTALFKPNGQPKLVKYSALSSWKSIGIPVLLPADAGRETFTLTIKGRGRTDGTKGFTTYAIKNFSFGPYEGWRTYIYDYSGLTTWTVSSAGSRVSPNSLFSGIVLSGTRYNALNIAGTAYADIKDSINKVTAPYKTQLVQNFVGLEPTKSYRLAVKGTRHEETAPGLAYMLRAKSKCKNNGSNYNVLTPWMIDAANYSSVNTVGKLNQYATDGLSPRRTYPDFAKGLQSGSTKPTDWGIYLGASGTEFSSVGSEDLRANAGEYTLSMRVFNQTDNPSYFVLSSVADGRPTFFNWENSQWDSFVNTTVPRYRNSVSGAYFLELPKERNQKDFTSYVYPNKIVLSQPQLQYVGEDKTPDTFGSRGDFKLTAALFGPNSYQGQCLVSDIALKGPGLGPNVDIWKELFYDFTNGDWQPTPASSVDYYSEVVASEPESFISTPTRLISKMCLYGLDRDTEYQLNIIDTSGGQTAIHDISLTDISLVANEGSSDWVRDASVWTSEPYGNTKVREYSDGAVFKLYDDEVLAGKSNPADMTAWETFGSVFFNATSATPAATSGGPSFPTILTPVMKVENSKNASFHPWMIYNFTLGEYGLKEGDNIAVGLEALGRAGTQKIYLQTFAMHDGQINSFNFGSNKWDPGFNDTTSKTFSLYNRSGQAADEWIADDKTWNQLLSPVISVPPFGPNTRIVVGFRTDPNAAANRDMWMKNFKVYSYLNTSSNHYRVSGETFNFPEFPKPMDTTLQSIQPSGYPGELGQFLNRINYFNYRVAYLNSQGDVSGLRAINNPMAPSITGEKTLEQAITMGAYLPSAGLYFGSGTYGVQNSEQPYGFAASAGLVSGVLNQMGVVNSDGYIYRHPHAGFIVSSYETGAGTYKHKTIRYILKLHKDDWRFLDYYMGGVGAMGLHAIDYKKSYEKLGTDWQLSATAASYSPGSRVGLYKVADPARNPVFNLTNKKVTFPPGLNIDYNTTDHITIIWDIDY
jgi:hypothetical protein